MYNKPDRVVEEYPTLVNLEQEILNNKDYFTRK
jgi:hypothetical protein